jgi:hypothetical protein
MESGFRPGFESGFRTGFSLGFSDLLKGAFGGAGLPWSLGCTSCVI